MNKEQYILVCARRQAFDNLIWQTPSLAMAAQAFLLAAALNPDYSRWSALALAGFSLIVGLASAHLMFKHRHHEREDCKILQHFERTNAADGYEVIHGRRESAKANIFVRVGAFRVWLIVLSLFCVFAICAGLSAWQRQPRLQESQRPVVIGEWLANPSPKAGA